MSGYKKMSIFLCKTLDYGRKNCSIGRFNFFWTSSIDLGYLRGQYMDKIIDYLGNRLIEVSDFDYSPYNCFSKRLNLNLTSIG